MDRSVLINTRVGVLAQRLREKASLVHTMLRHPELTGMAANDLIARVLLERLCLPGRTFVDVGAHIGSVIDGVRRYSGASAVIAVEAIPEKATRLRAKFPSVTVHGCALGPENGELPFFIDTERSGYSSLHRGADGRSGIVKIRVPVRRLDDLVGDADVDVVKIDVEGAELGVLRGASALVARARPTIQFESGPGEVGGYTKAALWELFDEASYAVLVPNRVAHFDDGLSREGFIEAHLHPRRTTNYFAVARERRDELRLRARKLLDL